MSGAENSYDAMSQKKDKADTESHSSNQSPAPITIRLGVGEIWPPGPPSEPNAGTPISYGPTGQAMEVSGPQDLGHVGPVDPAMPISDDHPQSSTIPITQPKSGPWLSGSGPPGTTVPLAGPEAIGQMGPEAHNASNLDGQSLTHIQQEYPPSLIGNYPNKVR